MLRAVDGRVVVDVRDCKCYQIKLLLTRLNSRSSELRGAAHPNQVHYYRSTSSITGTHRIYDRKAWPKFNVFNIFQNDCGDADCYIFRGRPQPKKHYHPSWNSLWEQPVNHHLRSGVYEKKVETKYEIKYVRYLTKSVLLGCTQPPRTETKK